MGQLKQTFVTPVYIFEIFEPFVLLQPGDTLLPVDNLTFNETTQEIIEQAVSDVLSIDDQLPSIGVVADALAFEEDISGIVKGSQKTIYITDERYIIRHDFG